MKRRKFIRSAAIGSTGFLLPWTSLSAKLNNKNINLLQKLVLKDFDQENEEYPAIVQNDSGNLWMFSLKRHNYPKDTEIISAFQYKQGKWNELDSVTKQAGHYEAHTAICGPEGKPIVAWSEKKGDDWLIQVSVMENTGFEKPVTFYTEKGRIINPTLHSRNKNRIWIAWEKLHQSKLSIQLCKFENDQWGEVISIEKENQSCFSPAMAEDKEGNLNLIYGCNQGLHQNIEMSIIEAESMRVVKEIPIAIGGGFRNRININAHPAIAFDRNNRLWISYENNRDAHRMEDGDNYTGDRCCAILSYHGGEILEPESGKWLFRGKNDHKPTFIHNNKGDLFLATHCGGDFVGNPFWKYRLSWLNEELGWTQPETILQTEQKSVLIPPAIGFDLNNNLWLASCLEQRVNKRGVQNHSEIVNACYTQLAIHQYEVPKLTKQESKLNFKKSIIEEYLSSQDEISVLSGHPKISGESMTIDGETYSLVFGNLHEHTENSPCWPAGTDGTIHEDYRFGMFSEGYDFVGLTDHGGSMTEPYWRKNLRLADFYNEPGHFVAIPAMEWTLTSDKDLNDIQHGAGHYNVIFKTVDDAEKFIRNQYEIYAASSPETNDAEKLWKLLDKKQIECLTIPHHPADEVHPVDWNVYNEKYVPVVELFQCRGNAEYPGCPREFNLIRHKTTDFRRAYIDYALNEKKHKMGFMASGDHNNMGVGVAALWVKKLSRDGIIEAMQSKRCYGTTGDKIIMDFRINGQPNGTTVISKRTPQLNIKVKGQSALDTVEILQNSKVVRSYTVNPNESLVFQRSIRDLDIDSSSENTYFYIRATQKNKEIAWSSPIWIEKG